MQEARFPAHCSAFAASGVGRKGFAVCHAEVKWFQLTYQVDSAGNVQELPVGPLCFRCGCSLDSFPEKSLEDVESLLTTCDSKFCGEWALVCKAVETCSALHDKPREPMDVDSNLSHSLKVILRAGLITTAELGTHLSVPASAVPNVSISKVPNPLGGVLEGVLCELASIPQNVCYYEVELTAEKSTVLRDKKLAAAEVVRLGQAQQTFDRTVQSTANDREADCVTPKTFATAWNFAQLQTAAKTVDESRKAVKTQEDAQRSANSNGGGFVMQVGGSRFDSGTPAPPADAARSKGPRRSRAAGSRSGGGGGVGSGGSSRPRGHQLGLVAEMAQAGREQDEREQLALMRQTQQQQQQPQQSGNKRSACPASAAATSKIKAVNAAVAVGAVTREQFPLTPDGDVLLAVNPGDPSNPELQNQDFILMMFGWNSGREMGGVTLLFSLVVMVVVVVVVVAVDCCCCCCC